MRSSKSGYTLLELVIVVSLIVISAAIMLPFFRFGSVSGRVNAARDRVSADLRMVQSVAVNRGGFSRLHFGADPAINRPGLYNLETCAAAANCSLPASWVPVISKPDPWYDLGVDNRGATITSIKDSGGTDLIEVRFNSLGASVNPAAPATQAVYPITLTISAPGGSAPITRTVTVQRTGSVHVN